jgi:superfamily II DNA or RNA helicase
MLADHQRSAVERAEAVLAMRGGVLLADEPGLGKSFVAAAIAADAQRDGAAIDLIVPAGLVAQWCETLRDFGVCASVVTHDGIITAPFVAEAAVSRLVIVDEAHEFRNPRTQRYAALARRTVAARVLLVTATPVCNSARDLQALIALIAADDILADAGVPSVDAAFARSDLESLQIVVENLVIRRDRRVVPPELQFGDLNRAVVRHAVAPVGDLIDSLQFPLVGSAPLLRRFLRRRIESSEAALLESIRRQSRFYERAMESLRGGRVLTKRDYRRAFAHEEDSDAFQQVLFWDVWLPESAERVTVGEIEEEMRRLDRLRAATVALPPVKRNLLCDLAADAADPMLIFTGSAATARDIFRALRGICRCGLATARDGTSAIEAFRAGAVDALVATDLASEGLNLQRAGVVVHYDIPWNPVKLDQRNGRAHRIGQKRPSVKAVYFLPEGDDTNIVATVSAKNRVRKRLLRKTGREVTRLRGDEAIQPRDLGTSPPRDCVPPVPLGRSSLRPRVTDGAAVIRFLAAVEKRGLSAPEWLERRHKAGLEQLLASMSTEFIDRARMDDLLAIIEAERR